MRAGADHVILKTTTLHDDTIQVGGKELYLDTSWEPHEHKRSYAEVVAIPDYLTDEIPVFQDNSGHTYYQSDFPITRKPWTIRVGDIAYADWSTIDEQNEIGENLYRVPYSQIYAAEREVNYEQARDYLIWYEAIKSQESYSKRLNELVGNHIIPLMSWVFLEPYFGENIVEEDGKRFRVNEGLATTTEIEEMQTVARIKHIGRNVGGAKPIYKTGDLVCCNLDWAATMKIQGKEMYAIRQNDLMGLYEA